MGWLWFAWGIGGIVALLGQTIAKLVPLAWQAIEGGLAGWQWAVLVVWVAFMAHAEGYRGFHRGYSPRVVARALWLRNNPRWSLGLLAPVFCMGLFHASRRRMWTSRIVVLGITALVVGVRMLSQPWRGIVDAGVVVGLAIGLVSMVGYVVRSFAGHAPPVSPQLPEDDA